MDRDRAGRSGTVLGVPLSWVPLTAVPQRTALSHSFGGLAVGLVGTAKYFLWLEDGALTPFRIAVLVIEVLLGFLTCTGSLMAAGKLQEIIPTRPITYRGQNFVNLGLLARRPRRGRLAGDEPGAVAALPADRRPLAAVRRAADHPDRRRRHADGDLAAQLLRRPRGRGDGLRAREQPADHRGRPRRLLGPDPLDHHVPGDEPLLRQRDVRRLRPGAGDGGGRGAAHLPQRDGPGRHADARAGEPRGGGARLRHGRGPGAAPRPRPLRPAHEARRRRALRDPPGGRAHARPHERAARRVRHPLRPADRGGGRQRRHGADRRRAGGGRERHREPRRPLRQGQPDLRHADHRRRQGAHRLRHQALA